MARRAEFIAFPGARSSWLRHFVFEYLLVLPMGALLALAWVIADPMSYYGFTMRAAFAVNDVAMVAGRRAPG